LYSEKNLVSRFSLDFTKSDREIINQIDIIVAECNRDLNTPEGFYYRAYFKIVKYLTETRNLLAQGQRIPALSKCNELIDVLRVIENEQRL
jgi:hypothetical protein